MGTAHYIAPEQARGEPVSERSDVYSLGCTLFHLLTGRAPYAVRVHLAAEGPFSEVVGLTGLLARPERGLVLERVHLSPRGERVSLDLEAVTLGPGS